MAVYGATKAFVLSFSEALWGEYRERGVRVLALCPGATDTPFFATAGEAAALGKKARPEEVVRLGLEAFRKNRPSVIHGVRNFWTAQSSRFSTRALTARVSAKIMGPKTP
jgi:short-subunit dehydrogenase